MRRLGFMLALLLLAPSAALAERSDGKRLYEQKCLYCHSGSLTDRLRLRPAQWKRLVARMRRHSPLLISAGEEAQIVRYLVRDRHLVPREPALARAARRPGPTPEPPVVTVQPAPVEPEREAPERDEPEAAAAETSGPETIAIESPDPEAEEKGPRLIAEKCSKCHTTRRVYMKVETVELGDAIIERMRHKTGSGISPEDAELLHRFLRARASLGASD
jgi:cytochrome c5